MPDLKRLQHERVGSRKRRRWLAIFAAPVAIIVMAFLAPAGAANAVPAKPSQPDTPNVTLYLTNASSYCADVKNSNNTAGAAIWLYKCSAGKSEHWYEVDGLQCGSGSPEFICAELIDVRATGLCMSMNGSRKVVLQNCGSNGNGDPVESLWIPDTGAENGWRNLSWGPSGDLAVASNKQGDALYGVNASAGCGGCWYRWTDS